MKTLESWSTYRDPWEAPELPLRIVGLLDGERVRTSRVQDSRGRIVITESGSRYLLGEPDPEYLKWLQGHDYRFDPENPIKLVKTMSEMTILR